MRTCHFIGIGGIGMSGLARLLLQKNITVTGSDLSYSTLVQKLEQEGATIYQEHSKENIQPDHTVVYNSMVKTQNPEYEAAVEMGCPLLHRSDLLKLLMDDLKSLTVTGTHGKTSTTGLLISLLQHAELDPSYATGGILLQTGTNASLGHGEYFVAEADESDGSFLKYASYGAIVTNIDHDHMDFYHTEECLIQAFENFISSVKSEEHFFWCGDDPILAKLHPKGISYGFSQNNELKGSNFKQSGWNVSFDVRFRDKIYKDISVPVIGQHQALNALAVFGMGISLNIPEDVIRKGLLAYQGTARRCEKKGEYHSVLVVDDYAHHPQEIKTTLKALRQATYPRRLVVVFQPHRFSRTCDLFGSFGESLKDADHLIVTDIYAAGETPIPNITTERLFREDISPHFSADVAQFIPKGKIIQYLQQIVRPHDCVVTVGAGDITCIGHAWLEHLKGFGIEKLKIGLIFGGRSAEHEISILSTKNIVKGLAQDIYDLHLFYISKEGNWVGGTSAKDILNGNPYQKTSQKTVPDEICTALQKCDILFPVLHGPYGEDGKIQGFFETLNLPYVGCSLLAAAMSMDKAITKKIAFYHGIDTVPFVDFDHFSFKTNSQMILNEIIDKLQFPVYVKPVHLGSTIGVQKVNHPHELEQAIAHSFQYDTHLLVENGIVNGREIEFAVLGNEECYVFPPGEIPMMGDIYGYEEKYGKDAIQAISKADLPADIISEGMKISKKIYQVLGCSGWARVDCFLDQNQKLWLNEVNPIPGCTNNSIYPMVARENGVTLSNLVDQLILLGFAKFRNSLKASK